MQTMGNEADTQMHMRPDVFIKASPPCAACAEESPEAITLCDVGVNSLDVLFDEGRRRAAQMRAGVDEP